jgi:hypothetical protein
MHSPCTEGFDFVYFVATLRGQWFIHDELWLQSAPGHPVQHVTSPSIQVGCTHKDELGAIVLSSLLYQASADDTPRQQFARRRHDNDA